MSKQKLFVAVSEQSKAVYTKLSGNQISSQSQLLTTPYISRRNYIVVKKPFKRRRGGRLYDLSDKSNFNGATLQKPSFLH